MEKKFKQKKKKRTLLFFNLNWFILIFNDTILRQFSEYSDSITSEFPLCIQIIFMLSWVTSVHWIFLALNSTTSCYSCVIFFFHIVCTIVIRHDNGQLFFFFSVINIRKNND